MSSVRQSGVRSWEIRVDAGPRDPITGKRKVVSKSIRGTKRDALLAAAKLQTEIATGIAIDPSRISVAAFLDRWLVDWVPANVSPKTAERYSEVVRLHLTPHLGTIPLQKLAAASLAKLYGHLLREGRDDGEGLSARSVGHVHRILHRALKIAGQWALIATNVADLVSPPRVAETEVAIIRETDLPGLLKALRAMPVGELATLALATGMRRGEMLALRWRDVDVDRAILRVEQSLETTKAGGLRFKPPKTRHGRRTVSLPPFLVADLRARWKLQQEQRLALGLGRLPDDYPVFGNIVDGTPMHPDSLSSAWRRAMRSLKRPGITLHSLRHTHASQLIAAGVDVLTISRRLGHGSPVITLAVYGHMFAATDDRAAAIVERTLANVASTE